MNLVFAVAAGLLAADPDPAKGSPEAVRERGRAATVRVVAAAGTGSGVLVKQDRLHAYVLTAAHVVADARTVEVRFAAAGNRAVKAEVLARAATADLAVLRLPAEGRMPTPLPVAPDGVTPKAVVSVGWAAGDAPTAIEETATGKARIRRPGADGAVLCWEVVRQQDVGRSGGPLLDESGRVVGLATGFDAQRGYYVHADEIRTFLRRNGLRWLTEEER